MDSQAIPDLTGESYREVLARLHECAVPGGGLEEIGLANYPACLGVRPTHGYPASE